MPLDMTFRLGDILTIIGGLVAAGGFLAFVKGSLKRQDEKQNELQRRMDEHRIESGTKLSNLEHRVRNTEQGHSAVVAKIEGMAEMLREVRDAVLRQPRQ